MRVSDERAAEAQEKLRSGEKSYMGSYGRDLITDLLADREEVKQSTIRLRKKVGLMRRVVEAGRVFIHEGTMETLDLFEKALDQLQEEGKS